MSERGFSGTIETALAGTVVNAALLVYLDWPGGAARYWTGVGDLSWDSQTWTGVGDLGRIDKVADGIEKKDIGVEMSLNLLNDTIRNEITTNDPRGRDASIYLAVMNVDPVSVSDAYELFPGFIDRVEIEDGGTTGKIIVRVVSELARVKKERFVQLSAAHQQWLYPGDEGMEFAAKMDEPVLWGRKPLQPNNPAYKPGYPSRFNTEGQYY